MTGAAVATVISQVGSCAFVLAFLFGSKPHVRITFSGYDVRVMRRVLLIGFTPFAIIAVDNVMIIAMNAVLKRYGGAAQGDMLLTCATIAQSFMLVVTMPLGGISSSTQTILSFNYGARRPDRVREAQKRVFVLCAVYTGLMMLVAWTCGGVFARLFTTDAGMADQAVWAIRVCSLALLPLGIQYEIVDGFTALGQVRYSLPLSFWRKLVYFVALFALPAAFGARAAFFAEPRVGCAGPGGFHRGLSVGHPPHSAAAGERPAGRMSRYSQEGRRRSSRRTLDQSNSAVSSSRSAGRSSSSRPAACASMPSSRCGVCSAGTARSGPDHGPAWPAAAPARSSPFPSVNSRSRPIIPQKRTFV